MVPADIQAAWTGHGARAGLGPAWSPADGRRVADRGGHGARPKQATTPAEAMSTEQCVWQWAAVPRGWYGVP